MSRIFHLTEPQAWQAARRSGQYSQSTRGRTLQEVGFIHASDADQWQDMRAAVYADDPNPLLLLEIDTDLLSAPVRREPGEPGGPAYPHVYGPIPLAAVVATTTVSPPHGATGR